MKPGDTWNGWTVESLIGEGGFGKVYKITRSEYGFVYESALKVGRIPEKESEVEAVRSEGLDEESVEAYFRGKVDDLVSEFTFMSGLRGNSNIVSYEDHEVVKLQDAFGWEVFIRMELLKTLSDHVRESVFTTKDVVRLGADICNALELCHESNIIHRDIKPGNIFYSESGNYKLGDFGIAREIEATSAMTRVGTYSYMAPEISKGLPYNSTVDIYSLGIVLYHLLNNFRLPFLPPFPEPIRHRDKEEANRKRMCGEEMPLPCNATGELGKVVLKACAYDPEDRYKSAAEFREALESAAVEKTVLSQPIFDEDTADSSTLSRSETTVPQEKGKKKKRKVWKVLLITLLSIVLILGGLVAAAAYLTDYYLYYYQPEYTAESISEEDAQYSFDGSWGYDPSKTKKLLYDNISIRIPSNWIRQNLVLEDEPDAQGKYAFLPKDVMPRNEFVTNSSRIPKKAWVQIHYLGEFSSFEELDVDESYSRLMTCSDTLEIEGASYVGVQDVAGNNDGEYVIAAIVIADGKAYWIGGGAFGTNFSKSNFMEMLGSIKIEEKTTDTEEGESEKEGEPVVEETVEEEQPEKQQ